MDAPKCQATPTKSLVWWIEEMIIGESKRFHNIFEFQCWPPPDHNVENDVAFSEVVNA